MQNKLIIALGLVVLIGIGGAVAYATMHPQTTAAPIETATSTPESTAGSNQKLNIAAVCQGALAYMTFNSGAEADAFVADCVAGNHPEVIERYKTDHNLNGATI